MNNKLLGAALGALAITSLTPAYAVDDPWIVRLRVVRLVPADESDAIPSLGVPADKITVNAKTIPDIDVGYFFTPNIAAELLLTIPQKHTVTIEESALGGPINIGTFKHLPPTLLAQYHFIPNGDFRPYVGAGINFTFITDDDVKVPGVGTLSLDNNSVGPAIQVGFDYKLEKNWFLSVDFKKIWIDSDVKINGNKISNVGINPYLFGVGLGYRF